MRFSTGDLAFPFAKVGKQFDSGLAAGESILSFYDIVVEYVASGRLRDRDGKQRTDAVDNPSGDAVVEPQERHHP